MTAIVSMGVATMMQNSFKEQRKTILMETLRSKKAGFESILFIAGDKGEVPAKREGA